MKTLIFSMSFIIIISVTEAAKATITCPLKDNTASDVCGCSISDLPSRRQANSQFSFFEYLTLTFDLNAPTIFAHNKPISGPSWNEDVSILPFVKDRSDGVVFKHFHSVGGFSQGNHLLFGNVRFPPDASRFQNLNCGEDGDPFDSGALFLTNDPGKHPDVGYDVIDIIPTPGAIILGGVGLGMIGWLRRYRSL